MNEQLRKEQDDELNAFLGKQQDEIHNREATNFVEWQNKINFNIKKDYVGRLKSNSKEYWEQRCIYLEISIDPTYTSKSRTEARELYMILVKK